MEDDKNKNENQNNENQNGEKQNDQGNEKKYSDADLDKIIGKKFAEWKAKEEKKVQEAERLAKMTAEEKANEEKNAAIKRAEEAEAKLERIGLVAEARKQLAEAKITVSDALLETLVTKDAETTKANITSFTALYNADLENAVKARIAGDPPKTGGKASVTKEEIMAIKDTAERHKMIREHMDLFTK